MACIERLEGVECVVRASQQWHVATDAMVRRDDDCPKCYSLIETEK